MPRVIPILTTMLLLTSAAGAEIRRSPTGANVNTQGATTVFISYGGLQNQVPAEALWCADLVPATPDIGMKCNPDRTWGRLPLRYELTRPSGIGGYTDIMTIPQNVARRAYESAAAGATSSFFYVRRFVSTTGGPDEYVYIVCRLAGGGASVPLALTDVKLQFATDRQVLSTRTGEAPPAFHADITYTGSGRLAGRWEVVVPGDEPPTAQDLLPEASLPLEQRNSQKHYAQVERFEVFLPPGGKFRLNGPKSEKLPVGVEGLYQILLRVEATNDKEGNSDLSGLGTGGGVVYTGGVAGFSLPALRYYVGASNPSLETSPLQVIEQVAPPAEGRVKRSAPLAFQWKGTGAGSLVRLEIRDAANAPVLDAVLDPATSAYTAPAWLPERINGADFSWRVVAVDDEGHVLESSTWRALHYAD